jgi:monofunctional glycosyltransferase
MARPDNTRNASLTLGLLRGLWRLFMRGVGRFGGFIWRWLRRVLALFFALVAIGVLGYAVFDPPTTLYIAAETSRLDRMKHEWVDFDEIAPVMARSVVAAEDANYCNHWGFDMTAIRQVIDAGESRGASTISQQVVKNVFLWPARSWPRKALEAMITPIVELVWSKRRILEVYLNMVEFDEGVFGVEAAAQHYFGVTAKALNAEQAARLAAVLPAPKDRSASSPSQFVSRRAASIRDGAATILRDGRAACFED